MSTKVKDLKPGDILVRQNTGGAIGETISALSDSASVHGGLAVGDGRIIEVNGGLGPDSRNRNRLFANIYVSALRGGDFEGNAYQVWRCDDAVLAEAVAIQAFPFAAVGERRSWRYDLWSAICSLRRQGSRVDEKTPLLSEYINEPFQYASVLDAALAKNKKFYCTQWVVYMYNKTASLLGYEMKPIPMKSKLANPKELAEKLAEPSSQFQRLDNLQL